jgi:hypothetical protein
MGPHALNAHHQEGIIMKHKRSVLSICMASIMLVSLCAVVSTTSVSAAQGSSRASVQATPSLVGSPIAAGTGPAVCILNGTTDMYVFVKGYDGALWYKIWDTSTSSWTGSWVSLGGKLSASPCAVSREAGVISAYVAGTDGAVYQKAYYGGAWHDWYKVGGKVLSGTGPAATGWTDHEDVFVTGTNGALYQSTWTQASPTFSSWVNLGGGLTSSPATTSRGTNLIEVHVRGTDGVAYGRGYYDGYWHGWVNLGGQVAPGTGPAASAWGTNREDVFVEGTNGVLYQSTWTGGAWSGWKSLGGQLSASPAAATFTYSSAMDIQVWVRGSNGLIYLKEYRNGAWENWQGPNQGPP